jgi:protein-tyrosine sulfotransferase
VRAWPAGLAELRHPAAEIAARLRGLPRGLAHPLERGEPVEPFFIVGSGRSGTTLLRRVLQASPEVHIPPEMHALGECIRLYRRNRTLPWPELVRTALSAFALDPEFERFGVALAPLAAALDGLAPRERSLARVLDALYRSHAAASGEACARWGDKTPLNAFALAPIRAVFPRARFVHLLRDGVDVAHSYVEAGLQPDLATAARRWRDSVAAVRRFAARHPARCLELRYEALVRAPERTLPALFRFLGLRWDPAFLRASAPGAALADAAHHAHLRAALAPIACASVGRGRRALAPAERTALERAIGPALAAAGYPPADAEPAP